MIFGKPDFLQNRDAFQSNILAGKAERPKAPWELPQAEDPEPSSLIDIWETSRVAAELTSNINAPELANYEAYKRRIDNIKKVTGEDLSPLHPLREGADNFLSAYRLQGDVLSEQRMLSIIEQRKKEFKNRTRALAEKYPEYKDTIDPEELIESERNRVSRDAERKAAETFDSYPGLVPYVRPEAYVAMFGGSMQAILKDPTNLTAMLLGPWQTAKPGLRGLATMAAKQGIANAGVEVGLQPFIHRYRQEAGLFSGLEAASYDVAAAFVLGGALDAGVRGAVRGVQRARGLTPELDETGGIAGWRRKDGTSANIPQETIDKAADGDAQALKDIAAETGLDADPAVRAEIDKVETLSTINNAANELSIDLDDGSGLAKLAKALRAAADEEEPPPISSRSLDEVDAERNRRAEERMRAQNVSFEDNDRIINGRSYRIEERNIGNTTNVDMRLRGEDGTDAGTISAQIKGNTAAIVDVIVEPGQRGRGLGTALYEDFIEEMHGRGLEIDSHTRVSFDAERVYDRLRNKGYDVFENPTAKRVDDALVSGDGNPVFRIRNRQPDAMAAVRALRDGDMRLARRFAGDRRDAIDNLARLSNDAFAKVENGEIEPSVAATIGEFVGDTSLHEMYAQRLIDADIKDPDQARRAIGSYLREGSEEIVQNTYSGIGSRSGHASAAQNMLEQSFRDDAFADFSADELEALQRALSIPGTYAQETMQRGNSAIIDGEDPSVVADAFVNRIRRALDREGPEALLRKREPERIDDPNGPEAEEAAAQAEKNALQRFREDEPYQWGEADERMNKGLKSFAAKINSGGVAEAPPSIVNQALDILRESRQYAPEDVKIAAFVSARRLKASELDSSRPDLDVVATYKDIDGSTFDIRLNHFVLYHSRAFFDPGAGPGGTPVIAIRKLGFEGDIEKQLRSELRHEAVHAMWRSLPKSIEERLFVHAESLGVLDMKMGDVLEATHHPGAKKSSVDLTLREIYASSNADRSADELDYVMRQEAVAHMVQLIETGYFRPEQIADIADELWFLQRNVDGVDPPVSPDADDGFMAASTSRTGSRTQQIVGAYQRLSGLRAREFAQEISQYIEKELGLSPPNKGSGSGFDAHFEKAVAKVLGAEQKATTKGTKTQLAKVPEVNLSYFRASRRETGMPAAKFIGLVVDEITNSTKHPPLSKSNYSINKFFLHYTQYMSDDEIINHVSKVSRRYALSRSLTDPIPTIRTVDDLDNQPKNLVAKIAKELGLSTKGEADDIVRRIKAERLRSTSQSLPATVRYYLDQGLTPDDMQVIGEAVFRKHATFEGMTAGERKQSAARIQRRIDMIRERLKGQDRPDTPFAKQPEPTLKKAALKNQNIAQSLEILKKFYDLEDENAKIEMFEQSIKEISSLNLADLNKVAMDFVGSTKKYKNKKAALKDIRLRFEAHINGIRRIKASNNIFSLTDPIPPGSSRQPLFSFAGRRAKNADLDALALAEQMEADGLSKEKIWKETGWFRGLDDNWKFEVDDSKAQYTRRRKRSSRSSGEDVYNLGSYLKHKAVFDQYPDLANLPTQVAEKLATFQYGRYQPDIKKISAEVLPVFHGETLDIILHELQHAIQAKEGFGFGSNPNYFTDAQAVEYITNSKKSFINNILWFFYKSGLSRLAKDAAKDLMYLDSMGEVEARTVTKRRLLTSRQRKARPPWKDFDKPFNKYINVHIAGEPDPVPEQAIDLEEQVLWQSNNDDWDDFKRTYPGYYEGIEDTWGPNSRSLFGSLWKNALGDPKAKALTPLAEIDMPYIRREIDKIVSRLPDGMRIELQDRLVFRNGDDMLDADAQFDPEQSLIKVSLATNNPVRHARHEEIHVYRQLGLLSDDEWSVLTKYAADNKLREKYSINERYADVYKSRFADPDKLEEILIEETIAEMWADRIGGKSFSGVIDAIIDRIQALLRSVARVFASEGYLTIDDVYRRIESGEVGRRDQSSAQRSLRSRDYRNSEISKVLDSEPGKAFDEIFEPETPLKEKHRLLKASLEEAGFKLPSFRAKETAVKDAEEFVSSLRLMHEITGLRFQQLGAGTVLKPDSKLLGAIPLGPDGMYARYPFSKAGVIRVNSYNETFNTFVHEWAHMFDNQLGGQGKRSVIVPRMGSTQFSNFNFAVRTFVGTILTMVGANPLIRLIFSNMLTPRIGTPSPFVPRRTGSYGSFPADIVDPLQRINKAINSGIEEFGLLSTERKTILKANREFAKADKKYEKLDTPLFNEKEKLEKALKKNRISKQEFDLKSSEIEKQRYNLRTERRKALEKRDETINSLSPYARSRNADDLKAKQYFSLPQELFARAFEVYIAHKAMQLGYPKSKLSRLIRSSSSEKLHSGDAVFDDMVKGFDDLFAALKTREQNKLYSGPSKRNLDMSYEARMQRARDMGFDTDTVYYHGTHKGNNFDSFDKNYIGDATGVDNPAFWFTSSKSQAYDYGKFADAAYKRKDIEPSNMNRFKAEVGEYYIPKNRKIIDVKEIVEKLAKENGFSDYSQETILGPWNKFSRSEIEQAKKENFPAIEFKNVNDDPLNGWGYDTFADHVAVFDPSNIRSVNAAFDPELSGESNLMYSFAGRGARNANLNALRKAEQMELNGRSRDEIWERTGWFRGVDGNWRWEMDDSNMIYLGGIFEGSSFKSAGDIFVHRDMYSNYPNMMNIPMQTNKVADAQQVAGRHEYSLQGEKIDIWARDTEELRSIFLHEMTHALQVREKFRGGGNVQTSVEPQLRKIANVIDGLNERLNELALKLGLDPNDRDNPTLRPLHAMLDLIIKDYEAFNSPGIRYEAYRRIAGEVEARTVQKRMLLRPEERKARPPWLDYDVPEDKQVTNIDDVPGQSMAVAKRIDVVKKSVGTCSR